MSPRLLLIVLSALFVGLVWQGEGLAQDKAKKDSGGKATSSPSEAKPAAAPPTQSNSTGGSQKKKVTSGGGGGAPSSGGAQKQATSPDRRQTGTAQKEDVKKPLPDSSTNTLKVEPNENASAAPAAAGGDTSTTQPFSIDNTPVPEEGGTTTIYQVNNQPNGEGPGLVVDASTQFDSFPEGATAYVYGDTPPEQVGNDVYVDLDDDGTVDVIYHDTHINEEGGIENGPPAGSAVVTPGDRGDDLTFYGRYDPDEQGDGIERPRATARPNLFGGDRAPAAAAQSLPAALPTGDVAQTLGELKSLYDKGLLPDSQYEIMQGQALAALDPRATGVEGGLQMLRGFWDQGLISADPYAAKRKEYLDAL